MRPALVVYVGGRNQPTPPHSRSALPPCSNEWGPACTPDADGPTTHRCWMWTGWPHICHCLRREGPRFALGGRP